MELKITINAPELAQALNNVACAMATVLNGDKELKCGEQPQQTLPNTVPINNVQVQQSAPVQQSTVTQPYTQAPVQSYAQVAPIQQYQQAPAQTTPMQQPVVNAPNVPVTEQGYTMDQLAVAATSLMDAGKRQDLVNLLGQFGVQALTALPKDQYGAFATALRGMGAKI